MFYEKVQQECNFKVNWQAGNKILICEALSVPQIEILMRILQDTNKKHATNKAS